MYMQIGAIVAAFVFTFWATIPFRRTHVLILKELTGKSLIGGIADMFADDAAWDDMEGMDYFWAACIYLIYLGIGLIPFILSWLLWFIPIMVICAIPIIKLIKNKRLKK